MQKLTIYDISKLAGVSITTVSRVLNGNDKVNPKTKEQVEAVIREHGYTPRQAARNFVQRDLFAVGLMVDDIRHTYMSELAYAVNQELEKWKLNTILCNLTDVEGGFIHQVDNLIEKRVNGVVLLGSVFERSICKIAIERRYSEVPFVTVNANFALPNVREVMQDQYQGLKDAVKYLYQKGKTRIGWIYCHQSPSDQRKNAGFLAGMKAHNLKPVYLKETIGKTLEEGKQATAALIDGFPGVEAIIYSSDMLAVGGVHLLNERKITIPDQIQIIGFNNSNYARECYPPLTTIDNHISESGRVAAQLMINMLNKQPAESIRLACGLAIRESTR
ncbi:LacI family DNA-binding transcriptional regulator [Lacrimispora sp.]|uniref:LacI family DNA-binding transcriptional regulator n=1 Tax=Lacrimispora sp. TaxID=2719234 RepID=UPI002FDA0AAA